MAYSRYNHDNNSLEWEQRLAASVSAAGKHLHNRNVNLLATRNVTADLKQADERKQS